MKSTLFTFPQDGISSLLRRTLVLEVTLLVMKVQGPLVDLDFVKQLIVSLPVLPTVGKERLEFIAQ